MYQFTPATITVVSQDPIEKQLFELWIYEYKKRARKNLIFNQYITWLATVEGWTEKQNDEVANSFKIPM